MKKFLLLSLALALTGCASSGLVGNLPTIENQSQASKVVVMRVSHFGVDYGAQIGFDGEALADIQGGKYTEFDVPPGKHSLSWFNTGKVQGVSVDFEIKPQETKYFLMGFLIDQKVGRKTAVVEYPEEKALKIIKHFNKFELKK